MAIGYGGSGELGVHLPSGGLVGEAVADTSADAVHADLDRREQDGVVDAVEAPVAAAKVARNHGPMTPS